MRIKNIDGLSGEDLQQEVKDGAKFIYYLYTVSLLVVTFKRTSGVYLVRKSENAVVRGLPFTIISALFGWWGIPFGPKYASESISANMKGGKDVTDEVMATVAGYVLFHESQKEKSFPPTIIL